METLQIMINEKHETAYTVLYPLRTDNAHLYRHRSCDNNIHSIRNKSEMSCTDKECKHAEIVILKMTECEFREMVRERIRTARRIIELMTSEEESK